MDEMKLTVATAVATIVFLCNLAHADMAPPPYKTNAISPDGSVVVRVTPGKGAENGLRDSNAQVSIYRYDKETDTYSRTSQFSLGELRPSEFLCVSDDGHCVAFVDIGRYDWEFLEKHNGMPLAVRIYHADGKLLKQFILSDLLNEEQINACAETGSTIQWLDGAEFSKEGLSIYGPAKYIRGFGPPDPIDFRGHEARVVSSRSFRKTINLKTLEIE
jgi:hypothetical protein